MDQIILYQLAVARVMARAVVVALADAAFPAAASWEASLAPRGR